MTTAPRLAIDDVSFTYPGGSEAVVDRWSQTFVAGTVTALTGPSGCGKSTRLYLLALLARPTAGRVLLDGVPVERLSDPVRARVRAHRFGFVFQDAVLDPTRTVLDNIVESVLYRHEDPATFVGRAVELMDRVGVEVPLHRRPAQISGGQAQRIALCRALLADPDVVFADEPTGNLDRATADVVMGAMRDHAAAGGCVVIVTHDPTVAAQADVHLDLGPQAA
ncbi:ATP-binding cassette domain-containing protein [Isoptericola sp. NEAU-Y5]|uniref:ATP-binding cassette domain-containing protein n=1 Tax=Isoptericola luteus TaxID=2879484 RepID=A0ABS7ZE44_9MICO|nr:ATP-binding cassette domain-containing protein [Isoptericola sp. NEAU-Y5]MCA5891879.1 ATP-binding cassette domain-containing protein [Isoptericola sp. NEAU-Y5]